MSVIFQATTIVCRDCLYAGPVAGDGRCLTCGGLRLIGHAELRDLTIAHIDCDSFYAAVEKRDRPELANRPLLIGGTSPRSVVATACYIARTFGCHSAMPMYKARALCPEAIVIPPDGRKYARVSADIRRLFELYTDVIEPIALDEAYLDLSHRSDIPECLSDIALRVEQDIGITVSVGLSFNKFLAKTASDLNKPRGFTLLGRAEAVTFLRPRPVRSLPGVGPAMEAKLVADGFLTVGDLQRAKAEDLSRRYGSHGRHLAQLAMAEDPRRVTPQREARSVSAETTFDKNLSNANDLLEVVARLAHKVEQRLARGGLAASGVVVKLKTADFTLITRHSRLHTPSQRAEDLLQAAEPLIRREAHGRAFRLIGIGADPVVAAGYEDSDLFRGLG